MPLIEEQSFEDWLTWNLARATRALDSDSSIAHVFNFDKEKIEADVLFHCRANPSKLAWCCLTHKWEEKDLTNIRYRARQFKLCRMLNGKK